MKEKTVVKTRTEAIFVCEVCGRESEYQRIIEQCERSHTCRHTPRMELVESDECCYSFRAIKVKCSECGIALRKFPTIELEDIEMDQRLLKKIYILIRRSQRIDKRERTLLNHLYGSFHVNYLFTERNK